MYEMLKSEMIHLANEFCKIVLLPAGEERDALLADNDAKWEAIGHMMKVYFGES